jgi:hypothetical protein
VSDKIQTALDGLKDFQLSTVNYVYGRLYTDGCRKMLIADEVGLGKTIVAKGIIAKAYAQFLIDKPKKTFNVIYVCSNRAIARQNLKKLNFTDDDSIITASDSQDDRMTGLAYEALGGDEAQGAFSIKAFTPATSFDEKTHAGRCDERVLLYRLLHDYQDIHPHRNSLKWILKGNRRIDENRWIREIDAAETYEKRGEGIGIRPIRAKVRSQFRANLEENVGPEDLPRSFAAAGITQPVKYWTLIRALCQLGIRKNNYDRYDFTKELISKLRFRLSRACIGFLQADIFILDEFQRYKSLIDTDTEDKMHSAAQLVRDIFNAAEGKILMLSATPFKAYTNDFDEMNGEVHHKEFETVLKFLNDKKSEAFWIRMRENRGTFFSLLRHPKNYDAKWDATVKAKTELEKAYRECMVRTERLIVSEHSDAMIRTVMAKEFLEFHPDDIHDFVGLDRLTVHLNEKHGAGLSIPMEYVKSSPFALSFLEHYQHKKKLKSHLKDDPHLRALLRKNKHAWVDLKEVAKYGELFSSKGGRVPNARVRKLLESTVSNGGWKLLWIPPTLPYYAFGEPYRDLERYSKTLIFSSWLLVPRMISTLVSYEAERLSVGNPGSISDREAETMQERQYFAKKRSPRPQFTFKVDKDEYSRMGDILYVYPCIALAQLYDPASNLKTKLPLDEIKNQIAGKIKTLLSSDAVQKYTVDKGDWKKWFWAAPLLLDKTASHDTLLSEWFESGMPYVGVDGGEETESYEASSGKDRYFEHLGKYYKDPKFARLPRLTESQLEEVAAHLAVMALGSPAICYLRTQLRYDCLDDDLLRQAFYVAMGFTVLFNKPESIAAVRLTTRSEVYGDQVLEYSVSGNLQAMLDEYVYLIRDLEGLSTPNDVREALVGTLAIRTSPAFIDDLESFLSAEPDAASAKKAMRTHFAADFGGQKLSVDKSAGRQVNIRQAFNSPFRPFVLATTSIGQEGLDFHLYCRKIFHWNLPSNAIDLEQREGRINRYKGLVIRQNLAAKYAGSLEQGASGNVWECLFQTAVKAEGKGVGRCELVPFWHTEAVDGMNIERYVPLYPFSRDIEKYQNLRKVLAYYRLTFGQPRQEELITALAQGANSIQADKLKELMINLSPIKFLRKSECKLLANLSHE